MAHVELVNRPLRYGVITVSDTRTLETDKGGQTVIDFITGDGGEVVERAIVHDEYDEIHAVISKWAEGDHLDVIITTGGTGIAERDVTIEVSQELITKEIPGFGEFFRYLSFTKDIGPRAMASRAIAGVVERTLLFSLPGSVGAVTLGMRELIIPEAKHLVNEIYK